MGYGHGISVSLAQLARAYTVFARDGELVPLTLVKTGTAVSGEKVLSAETARAVRAMLELAVQPGGTGPRARVMGWRVAGKTGTAHKQENGAYAPDKYLSSFVGFAPGQRAAPGGGGDDRRALGRAALRRRGRGAGVLAGHAGRAAAAQRAARRVRSSCRRDGEEAKEST